MPRLADKPRSVHRWRWDDHLSRRIVTKALKQPTRNSRKTSRLPFPAGNFVPAWPCSRWGLPGRRITATPVVSYTAVSPLPPKEAVCFCGPIRQVSPPRVLPGILLCGARTFLDLDTQGRDRLTNLGMLIIPLLDVCVNCHLMNVRL